MPGDGETLPRFWDPAFHPWRGVSLAANNKTLPVTLNTLAHAHEEPIAQQRAKDVAKETNILTQRPID